MTDLKIINTGPDEMLQFGSSLLAKGLKCRIPYILEYMYSKTYLKRLLKKKTKNWFQDRLSLNTGQNYCRML